MKIRECGKYMRAAFPEGHLPVPLRLNPSTSPSSLNIILRLNNTDNRYKLPCINSVLHPFHNVITLTEKEASISYRKDENKKQNTGVAINGRFRK